MDNPQTNEVERTEVFATTQWQLVVDCCETDPPVAEAALAELCEIYWRPIYFYIRRRGYGVEDAEDLTQDFFAHILAKQWLDRADPMRGKFRAFLLTSLKRFLIDANERAKTQKRGGSVAFISFHEATAELQYIAGEGNQPSPEATFDAHWAASVVREALRRLAERYENEGKGAIFRALKPFLAGEAGMSTRQLANSLGLTVSGLKTLLYRMRQRYGELLRDEVAKTLTDPNDVDAEISYLCSII